MTDIKGPVPEDGMFTRQQVCRIFGVPEATLDQLLATGPDPYAGIGASLDGAMQPLAQLGQIVVEVDLGPDDVLVLCYDRVLKSDIRAQIAEQLKQAITTEGRQVIVLEDGMVPMVLHRTLTPEDKARSKAAKPYLEERPAPAAGEAPRETSEGRAS
jgi:hypothetical protein